MVGGKQRHMQRSHLVVRVAVLLALVLSLLALPEGGRAAANAAGVETLTGTATVSNPLLARVLSEPLVLLADLTNFVHRDINAPIPAEPEVTAELTGSVSHGTFTMPLPIAPQGKLNKIGPDAGGAGVEIFSVDLEDNMVGDPFIGPYEAQGWGTSLTSIRVADGTNEIVGGRVVVWAPDDRERFPSDFGPDGKLFTRDDPLAPLPSGWTVIDLDHHPFQQIRTTRVAVPIIEGGAALQDLSLMTYTAAFDSLVRELRLRYPFTAYKHINWDSISAQIRPQVVQAEQAQDPVAFNVAIMRFTVLLGDAHVGVQLPGAYLAQQFGGGVGLTLGETDAGELIASGVAPDSPAATAGIKPGARIVNWAGKSAGTALRDQSLIRSVSSPQARREEQLALLPRLPAAQSVVVAYQNPGSGTVASATLTAVPDRPGLLAALGATDSNPSQMPVTVQILPSGIGYIRVNTFLDDPVLISHGWEWALNTLKAQRVPALIVDVRGNGGGLGALALYLAGSFTNQQLDLADAYSADAQGQLVYGGTLSVLPAPVQWDKPVAVLIDTDCGSACELFAAALARNPAHLIVGQEPTAGAEGSVSPWKLPGGLYFQAPLGLLKHDGKVWLEGTGVAPTLKVPVTVQSLISGKDVVLAAAEQALAVSPTGKASVGVARS